MTRRSFLKQVHASSASMSALPNPIATACRRAWQGPQPIWHRAWLDSDRPRLYQQPGSARPTGKRSAQRPGGRDQHHPLLHRRGQGHRQSDPFIVRQTGGLFPAGSGSCGFNRRPDRDPGPRRHGCRSKPCLLHRLWRVRYDSRAIPRFPMGFEE